MFATSWYKKYPFAKSSIINTILEIIKILLFLVVLGCCLFFRPEGYHEVRYFFPVLFCNFFIIFGSCFIFRNYHKESRLSVYDLQYQNLLNRLEKNRNQQNKNKKRLRFHHFLYLMIPYQYYFIFTFFLSAIFVFSFTAIDVNTPLLKSISTGTLLFIGLGLTIFTGVAGYFLFRYREKLFQKKYGYLLSILHVFLLLMVSMIFSLLMVRTKESQCTYGLTLLLLGTEVIGSITNPIIVMAFINGEDIHQDDNQWSSKCCLARMNIASVSLSIFFSVVLLIFTYAFFVFR